MTGMKATTKGRDLMGFDALDISLRLIRELRNVVARLGEKNSGLADQVIRAASSVAANLGEGRRRLGKDRANRFRIADGSAHEVEVHLRVALAWGWVEEEQIAEAMALVGRVQAMTWRLSR